MDETAWRVSSFLLEKHSLTAGTFLIYYNRKFKQEKHTSVALFLIFILSQGFVHMDLKF